MSECGVCIGGSCGFEIEDYSRALTTSKRNWTCCECNRTIEAGAQFEKVTGCDEDGTPVLYRTCLDCANIAEGLSCDMRVHTTLWDDLEDYSAHADGAAFENFSEACVAKVKTASAKAYLVHRWRIWKGLEAPPSPANSGGANNS